MAATCENEHKPQSRSPRLDRRRSHVHRSFAGDAGLLVRTLVHLQTLQPGFDATNVMAAQASLDDARYHNAESFQRLMQQSLAAMKSIPGVESAAFGLSLPFERGLNDGFHVVDGPEKGPDQMSQFSLCDA